MGDDFLGKLQANWSLWTGVVVDVNAVERCREVHQHGDVVSDEQRRTFERRADLGARKERAHERRINRQVPSARRRWFSVAETARLLGVPASRIEGAIYRGDIDGVVNLHRAPHAPIRLCAAHYVWIETPARVLFKVVVPFLWLHRPAIIAWCERAGIEVPAVWRVGDGSALPGAAAAPTESTPSLKDKGAATSEPPPKPAKRGRKSAFEDRMNTIVFELMDHNGELMPEDSSWWRLSHIEAAVAGMPGVPTSESHRRTLIKRSLEKWRGRKFDAEA